jgi:hypothetical protein
VGDVTWLETGLLDTSTQACRRVVEGLLAIQGLRIPGDERREGERCVGGVKRTLHTRFGDVGVTRNWYKAAGDDEGRYPLDVALGLVDGYTPARPGPD